MKRIYFLCLMALLTSAAVKAQELTYSEPVLSSDGGKLVYWTDSTANNEKVLNKTKFWDNWFFGLHVGTRFSWGSNSTEAGFQRQFRPAAAISVGKWLAPAAGLRLMAAFGNNRGHTDPETGVDKPYTWNSVAGYLDGLFNLTNMFCGYKESRGFNLIGVMGVGVERSFHYSDKSWNTNQQYYNKDNTHLLFALRLGLMAKIRLGNAWDLDIEAVNTWTDDSFDGNETNNRYDGHVGILCGFTYRFKNHDGTRQFTYVRLDQSKYDVLNDEINRLRQQVANRPAVTPTVQSEIVQINRIRTLISFENGKSEVNQLQEVNVFTAADALKNWEGDADLYITCQETPGDSDLFLARAQSVRDMLVNQMSVPAGRIFIEKNPAVVQSLDDAKNCVIVIINE